MNNIIERVWHQNKMVKIEDLRGMAFQSEAAGHTFQISGVDKDGNALALSGTVSGVFLRPDNTDVAITGAASGGVVSVTLPAECYDVPGRFGLTVYVSANGEKVAVYAAMGTVSRASSGTVSPGTVGDVVDLINRINAAIQTIPASWSGLMADIAPDYSNTAVYPAGAYVYYDGDLYRSTTAITTAETFNTEHWRKAVLGTDVNNLKNAFDYASNSNTEFFLEELGTTNYIFKYNDNKAVETSHDVINLDEGTLSTPGTTTSTWKYCIIPCAEGDIFHVRISNATSSFRPWAFVQSDGTKISVATANNVNVTLTAPANSAYLVCNVRIVDSNTIYKVTRGTNRITNFQNGFKSRFSGKKISIIGDSIDTFDKAGYKIDGYNMYYPKLDVTDVNQTWWMRVINNSGAELDVNASWSGSRVTNTHSDPSYPDFYDRVGLLGNPDVIFVTLGVNDSLNDVALGEYDFDTEYTNLSESEFRPAYIKGVKALQTLYPSAKIICVDQYMAKAYRQSVVTIAKTLGVGFIDAGDYTRSSGVHPGNIGMQEIAANVLYPTDQDLLFEGIPADGKKVGDEISNLKGSWNYLEGSFELGDWRSDIPKTKLNNRPYRVRSASQLCYPYDIELTADEGYYFYFHTYNGDEFRLDGVLNFKPHYATIPANVPFDITISADPLDTSITADPETYRKAVKVCRRRFETYPHNWGPMQRSKVLISGHRGWMGDTANYPENSVEAFTKAAQMGVWMIETDIQETKDGYFVCMHDSTVDRTTDGTGTIAEKTLEEVKALHLKGGDGTLTVPTLEEYLGICKIYNIVCHIEIKEVLNEKTSLPRVVELVKNYGLHQQTSYNPHSLTAMDILRRYAPLSPIHLLVETISEEYNTFEKRMNALECMGSIRSGTDDFGNTASLYKEQVSEMHNRNMIVAKLSSSWSAQKAYLKVGFDYILSNDNLTASD